MINDEHGVDGDEVLALAKWLVLRMSNRVTVAVASGRDSRTERLAAKLANILATAGPLKVRELVRKCSRLSAGECRKALALLAERRLAVEQDGLWGIRGDSPLAPRLVACGDH